MLHYLFCFFVCNQFPISKNFHTYYFKLIKLTLNSKLKNSYLFFVSKSEALPLYSGVRFSRKERMPSR